MKLGPVNILFTCSLILFSSCVTTKKSKSETGWLKTKMHDMNARYNGYFNAKELYKASLVQLAQSHEDNYNHILKIYPYGTDDDRKSIEANMDKAIEKVVKVAALHEPSKWVDDCYVMMGKAQYLKGDYESAQETFEYFIDDFNPSDPDSRVYQSPDRKSTSRDKKKKKDNERKIQKEEREKKKEEKTKTRKQEAKERKKARKQAEKERKQRNKDRKKGKRTSTPKQVVTPVEEPQEEADPIPTEVASTDNSVPLDPDEEYLRELAEQQQRSKDKKIEKGKTGGLFKHKPAYYEGMYWLSRTFVAREKWIEANYFLEKLESDERVPEKIKNDASVVRADYFLQQKDYRNGIDALKIALEKSKDRVLKARMSFILAQAYQMNGQAAEAQRAFDRVKKFKTTFEMDLYAKLNQLKNSWAAGDISSKDVTKKLNRFAKEDKNRNYLGGIYSTIAEIMLVDGNQVEAMEYFKKALENSNNNSLKSEIYYRLGSLFFANEDYLQAKLYYDSTLVVMDEKDERFNPTTSISKSLKNIAKNIGIIQVQDSLLRLGRMSEGDLEKFAKDKAEKEWAASQATKKESDGGFQATTSVFSGNSKFFAYNQASKQRGRQDFGKRWGNRPLEDNWRRSNKSSSVFDQEELSEEIVSNEIPNNILDKEMEKILRTIPTEKAEQEETLNKIEVAMFELGTGFRSNLNNYSKSNETLLKLLERFPNSSHRPEAMYFIHLNFLDLAKDGMASSFKNRLINEFPESSFAKYLKDPLNSNALITEERQIEIYYEETYKLFEAGQYDKTSGRLALATSKFGEGHHMIAKFDLLNALCIGNLQGQDEYINALRKVILKYDKTPEQTYAREMLRFLRGDKESFSGEISEEELKKYVVENEKLHYVLGVIYNADSKLIEEIKTSIENFNKSSYESKRLRVTALVLNKEEKSYVILIRRFTGKDDSMVYYKDVSSRLDDFADTKKYSYDVYAINQKNYRTVVQDHAIGSYRVFFDQKYLGIE